MKKKIPWVLVCLLLSAGLTLLLYPTISNWLMERNQSIAIQEYDASIAEMAAQALEEELQKAREYNDALSGANIEDPFVPESGRVLPVDYTSILNVDGMIGHIEIPIIDVYQPIYHGTGEEVLEKGVGHMQYTAFPIGGEGNHTVLTGHTGLTSARLFTDLDQLETGDVFYIHVLDEILAYEVDQILVVEPSDTDELLPVAGKDYVTLVTCTPYGINSHRLFVRGTRIPYEEAVAEQADGEEAEINWRVVIIVSFTILAALAFVIYKCINKRKQRGRGL